MKPNDDDIKIFHPKKKEGAGSELTSMAAAMDRQRANGNSAKACILGERLADLIPEEVFPQDCTNLRNNELLQLRSLMVFASQISLTKYLPHSILATQAINAMYARLESTAPGFFANIADGSSFSFYYLAVRRASPDAEIGSSYAMLCDDDDSEKLKALGTKAFEFTEAKVIGLIEQFEFEG